MLSGFPLQCYKITNLFIIQSCSIRYLERLLLIGYLLLNEPAYEMTRKSICLKLIKFLCVSHMEFILDWISPGGYFPIMARCGIDTPSLIIEI